MGGWVHAMVIQYLFIDDGFVFTLAADYAYIVFTDVWFMVFLAIVSCLELYIWDWKPYVLNK